MPTDLLTPIDRYLAEQQGSTAVETFAQRHDADLIDPEARWYADRLPATPPGAGQQYAFRVDLDQCTGCKACVAGCHSLNGLDEGESWRFAGQLVRIGGAEPHTQTVPSGCHHCLDPACLSGCPTNAYAKDPITGIVRHLDDQCIGCGYCELTCPYEVPKLNKRLGIVRKCDMCSDRLSAGEAPACVQACPTGAIAITVVETGAVIASSQSGALVPGAPQSVITKPTTQYVTERGLPDDLDSADHHALHLSRSHPPLAFMLVMTQLSVGAFLAVLAADWFGIADLPAGGAIAAALAGVVALAASVLHLGRPEIAYRAVLGFSHSWLSREIVAFGAYAGLASAYAIAAATDVLPDGASSAIGAAAAVCGIAGVACSGLIYSVTKREWWAARYTVPKFAGTAAITGPMLVATVLLLADFTIGTDIDLDRIPPLVAITAVTSVLKLGSEVWFMRRDRKGHVGAELDRTAHLLMVRLSTTTRWRFGLGVVGGIVGPVALSAAVTSDPGSISGATLLAAAGLASVVSGELIERYQYFVASVTPRMPGGFRR